MENEWHLNEQDAKMSLNFKDVLFLRNALSGFFIHGRDHALSHAHVFCPYFAWTVYKKTFGDIAVYEPMTMSPSQASVFLQLSTKKTFLKQYKWGINTSTSTLPIAYLLLKRKKQYRAARPIISYSNFVFAKLFKATAIVLDLLIRAVCPKSSGLQLLPQMPSSLIAFLQSTPEDFDPTVHNQDLVGFFISIPVQRILDSVAEMIQLYCEQQKVHLESPRFSVLLQKKEVQLRIWRGKPRQGSRCAYYIFLKDVLPICQLSWECSIFSELGKTLREQRGTTIGNQISPMLAKLTVSLLEQQFFDKYSEQFARMRSQFFCVRYVDNRLLILDSRWAHLSCVQKLCSDMFYGSPVELQIVKSEDAEQEFLGFDARMSQARIAILIRQELWKIRHSRSAGHTSQKLAAYRSKRYNIARHIWPPEYRAQQIQQLQDLFRAAGYSISDLPRA